MRNLSRFYINLLVLALFFISAENVSAKQKILSLKNGNREELISLSANYNSSRYETNGFLFNGIPDYFNPLRFGFPSKNKNETFFSGKISSESQLDSVLSFYSGNKLKTICDYSFAGDTTVINIVYYEWNDTSGFWVFDWSEVYRYDSHGNMLLKQKDLWDADSGDWHHQFRLTYSYDDQGNELSYLMENWDDESGSWRNNSRGFSSYDDGGKILSYNTEIWDASSGAWVSDARYSYGFDDNGYLSYWEIIPIHSIPRLQFRLSSLKEPN